VAQELEAAGAFPLGIGIGKMHPDIALSQCAKNCIGDRVRQHIGIGMAIEAYVGFNADAGEN
jgi:hypothetical protein